MLADDVGIPLQAGSRVIMQVHYNLLEAQRPDVSSARLRLAAGDKDLAALHTMLLPAPVELPCRPKNDDGPLCDRDAAIATGLAIGVAEPPMATATIAGVQEQVAGYDLRPSALIEALNLRSPQFQAPARHGHFGNNFAWDA